MIEECIAWAEKHLVRKGETDEGQGVPEDPPALVSSDAPPVGDSEQAASKL